MSSVDKTISVVGGVYEERCCRPAWHEVFGSAGRAASALSHAFAGQASKITLHTYVDDTTRHAIEARCALENSTLLATEVNQTCRFRYLHGLARPEILRPANVYAPILVEDQNVLRFGMLEGNSVVKGNLVVYDPQSSHLPELYHANGSVANRLAVVINEREALVMTGMQTSSGIELARAVRDINQAHVVVLKRGPLGAVVVWENGEAVVPAFATSSVWKLGSGDVFSAHFSYRWALEGRAPRESAFLASKATALYCQTRTLPSADAAEVFDAEPIVHSAKMSQGLAPLVYLAGPFFSLGQVWLIEQARTNLRQFGLRVFSPYHDVGYGSASEVVQADLMALQKADLVFAVCDGLDSGTIFEIGYARARGTPVMVYSENESREDLKMMEGSDCQICSDYVSAIYRAMWMAISP